MTDLVGHLVKEGGDPVNDIKTITKWMFTIAAAITAYNQLVKATRQAGWTK